MQTLFPVLWVIVVNASDFTWSCTSPVESLCGWDIQSFWSDQSHLIFKFWGIWGESKLPHIQSLDRWGVPPRSPSQMSPAPPPPQKGPGKLMWINLNGYEQTSLTKVMSASHHSHLNCHHSHQHITISITFLSHPPLPQWFPQPCPSAWPRPWWAPPPRGTAGRPPHGCTGTRPHHSPEKEIENESKSEHLLESFFVDALQYVCPGLLSLWLEEKQFFF